MAEAHIHVAGGAPPRPLPDFAEAIVREARQSLLDARTLAPLEDVVLRGASVSAVVTNTSGERYVVTVRRVRPPNR